jgi:hypothetical protein
MSNVFNGDFIDFLKQFNHHEVEYLLVGGYSVILYGYARTTGDMDVLVKRTPENYQRICKAFRDFGMPLFDMTEYNFLKNNDYDVFTFGRQPVAIDIMIKIKGAEFEELYRSVNVFQTDDISINVIRLDDLLKVKKESGRHKDLDDIQNLTKNK